MTEPTSLDRSVLDNVRPEVVGWLDAFVGRHGGSTGCVYLPRNGILVLVAAFNMPSVVQNAVVRLNFGEGVVGIAAERREPVVLRHQRSEAVGIVRSHAPTEDCPRESVTVPVLDIVGRVRAVVAIGFRDERRFADDEAGRLRADAASVLEVS